MRNSKNITQVPIEKLWEGNVFYGCLSTGKGSAIPHWDCTFPSESTPIWYLTPSPWKHKSGWYASYWHAFLYINGLVFEVQIFEYL